MDFLVVVELLVIFLAWVILRLLPHHFAPGGIGVDHWYWKAYIDAYRKDGKIPPELPQFLLEEHQWYPPLFPLLVARLPKRVFESYSYTIANGIDMVRMLFAMAIILILTGQYTPMLVVGVIYTLTPILISYNAQLNSRCVGALFLDIVIISIILLTCHTGLWWLWIPTALFSGLILLTHKMTTQLLWFLSLSAGVLSGNWRFILLIPISIVMALMLSKGFYFKTLRAHWDIVTFWNRNWRWISAHPVLESPIYGIPGYETPTKYYRSGLKGFFRRMMYLIGFNPWAWSLLAAACYMYGVGTRPTPVGFWIIQWLAAILLFACLTTFIPAMRCLGQGYLYLYNSSFPAALAAGIIWRAPGHNAVVDAILSAASMLCVISIVLYFCTLKKSKTLKADSFMIDALERLCLLPDGAVICFPQHWHDVVAYKSAKAVLFGAHGYGFKRLEFIFPRLTKPISDVINEHNVKYLLTYNGYLPANFLEDLPAANVEKFGQYRLYRF
jgi:hypothetical protein